MHTSVDGGCEFILWRRRAYFVASNYMYIAAQSLARLATDEVVGAADSFHFQEIRVCRTLFVLFRHRQVYALVIGWIRRQQLVKKSISHGDIIIKASYDVAHYSGFDKIFWQNPAPVAGRAAPLCCHPWIDKLSVLSPTLTLIIFVNNILNFVVWRFAKLA